MKNPKVGESYSPQGNLIIIGGHEDKEIHKENKILREVCDLLGSGKLVIATVASDVAEEVWEDYKKVFHSLGIKKLEHLDIDSRQDAFKDKALKCLKDAKGIFFSGGDQLRITADIGGTDICNSIHDVYARGGVIAGTSAGASVMGDTMMVSGPSDETARSKKSVITAPGLGFMKEVIIDQHFAQRGRISRLMAAITMNPRYLGIGIDEDTAIVVEKATEFRVIGSGGVYILDGRDLTDSNISSAYEDEALSVHNMKVHVLNEGERFDLTYRKPVLNHRHQKEIQA